MPYERIPLPVIDGITRRSSIRRVLLVILAFSLLPLVVLATWNGMARLQIDTREQQRQLVEAARLTASSEMNVIQSARTLLTMLASNEVVRDAKRPECDTPLSMAAAGFPAYSYFTVIDPTGKIICASNPDAVGGRVDHYPHWHSASRKGFSVSQPLYGEYSKREVLWAMLPLKSRDGQFREMLSASIDLAWLKQRLMNRPVQDDMLVVLADSTGRIVASSRSVAWEKAPDVSEEPHSGTYRDYRDNDWYYASAPLHVYEGEEGGGVSYHIIYAVPAPGLLGPHWWIIASTFALPVLALFLASVAIWFGANRAILRWIGHLGRLAHAIGEGNYRSRQDAFAAAPDEIRGLAADLQRMARAISERDRKLQEGLDRQRALTFELHHRVRNNLQIIASYLRLQEQSGEDADRPALANLRLRVGALALVHRLLFDGSDDASLTTRELIDPLCRLLGQELGGKRGFDVSCDVEEVPIAIDTAIPLTLWLVETVDRLVARGTLENEARILIKLTGPADSLSISVEASGLGPEIVPNPLTTRLVQNMSRQLGGHLEQVELSPSAAAITLHIKPRESGDRQPEAQPTQDDANGNNGESPQLETHSLG